MSAHDFMRYILSEKLGVKVLITGYDHRFGHNRSEGFDDYVRYGEQMGMEVILGKPYIYEGVNVSSSVVRALISEGEVDLAANCLGYRYTLLGHVESGHHIGTGLGFPTANIHPDSAYKMIPANGVYAVMVRIAGEQADRKAMLNIGNGGGCRRSEHGTDVDSHIEEAERAVSLGCILRVIIKITYHHLKITLEESGTDGDEQQSRYHKGYSERVGRRRDGKGKISEEHHGYSGHYASPITDTVSKPSTHHRHEINSGKENTVNLT